MRTLSSRIIEANTPPAGQDASCRIPADVEPGENGLLVVDKPEGLTSFGVVARVKRRFKLNKAGHCGTLDPFATGVLVICVNQATRIADQLLNQSKLYRFSVHLGVETDTLDRTGTVVRTCEQVVPAEDELLDAVRSFEGKYVQAVPLYSAKKVQGRRLYDLARRGVDVELPEQEVHIHELKLLSYQYPEIVLEARCSKGTYIRRLASDLGCRLGCGGHVSELRRLGCGSFGIEQATTLERILDMPSPDALSGEIVPMSDALAHLPALVIRSEESLERLRFGHLDPIWEIEHRDDFADKTVPVRLVTGENRLAALWWPHSQAGQQRRLRLFRF